MGGFTSNVDMRTGSPAFGTPEYVHAVIAGAQIGRRLKLPVRTSAVNASPMVDAQSTYETGFSLQAAILSHSHLINHAAGWLEGGLSASLEKIIVDAELLRNWAEILKPVSFSDDDLAVDAIKGIAAGGHFFGSAHTLARYEIGVLPATAVGLVELRELARRRLAQRDRSGHRHLEEDARGRTCRRRWIRQSGKPSAITWRAARASCRAPPERGRPLPSAHDRVDRQRAHVRGDAGRGGWRGASCSAHIAHAARRRAAVPAVSGAAAAGALWSRADLGAVFMCGYPVALKLAPGDGARRAHPARALGAGHARSIARTSSCARTPPTSAWRTPSAAGPAGR